MELRSELEAAPSPASCGVGRAWVRVVKRVRVRMVAVRDGIFGVGGWVELIFFSRVVGLRGSLSGRRQKLV